VNARYALPAEPRDPYLGTGLWSRRDLLVLLVLYVGGAAGLVIAWYGSAAEADWRDTAKWLVTATGGLMLAGLGLLAWLVLGKLRITAAERAVRLGLLERRASKRDVAVTVVTDGLVTADGMRRYHRPTCLLMAGKQPVPFVPGRSALTACGVCEP
jgi:hypothetical protein